MTNALQQSTSVMPMLCVVIHMVHTTALVNKDIPEMVETAQVRSSTKLASGDDMQEF